MPTPLRKLGFGAPRRLADHRQPAGAAQNGNERDHEQFAKLVAGVLGARIEDHVGLLVGSTVSRNHLRTAADNDLIDITTDLHLAVGEGDRYRFSNCQLCAVTLLRRGMKPASSSDGRRNGPLSPWAACGAACRCQKSPAPAFFHRHL